MTEILENREKKARKNLQEALDIVLEDQPLLVSPTLSPVPQQQVPTHEPGPCVRRSCRSHTWWDGAEKKQRCPHVCNRLSVKQLRFLM